MLSATQTTLFTCGVRHSCRVSQVYSRCLRLLGVKPCWVATSGKPKRQAASQPSTRPLKPWALISPGPVWRTARRSSRGPPPQRRMSTPAVAKRWSRLSGPSSSHT